MSKTTTIETTACGWCVSGNHGNCRGPVRRPEDPAMPGVPRFSRCACADEEHQPTGRLARKMAGSLRPDLARDGGSLLDEVSDAVRAHGEAFAGTRA